MTTFLHCFRGTFEYPLSKETAVFIAFFEIQEQPHFKERYEENDITERTAFD
jgi:hypothetical protein